MVVLINVPADAQGTVQFDTYFFIEELKCLTQRGCSKRGVTIVSVVSFEQSLEYGFTFNTD